LAWAEVIAITVISSELAGVVHPKPLVTRTKATRNRLVKTPAIREGRCIMLTIC
jgi:hypothetical protein